MISATQTTNRRRLKRSVTHPPVEGDMLVKLYELLQGERDSVKFFSRALNSDICFVNPSVTTDLETTPDCPIYTTRELSFILSLSASEFQRYHYLKMKLA